MPANAALLDYLKTRRSVGVGFLQEPGPNAAELSELLTIGTRVPDHGKLTPWRLVLWDGDARVRAGEKLAEVAKRNNPAIDESALEADRRHFLPAPLTVGVIFSPKQSPKIPELEQFMSAVNVCFALEHAAFALGYAATWTSRWVMFDAAAQQALGARGGERFVGFIHIGTAAIKPEDRPRPALESVVSRWTE
ncbi:nitroreductase [Devosia sp.]|jgi:nitroreductase|uniref:nitroreductase n=1 Tax=Devosia sp. TaxID=1871048 RepID=UPI0037C148AC